MFYGKVGRTRGHRDLMAGLLPISVLPILFTIHVLIAFDPVGTLIFQMGVFVGSNRWSV